MLFGLGLSIAVLCLTTYFVINVDLAIQVPENATDVDVIGSRFIPVWAGIQIVTALCTLLTYCVVGFRANEAVSAVIPCDAKNNSWQKSSSTVDPLDLQTCSTSNYSPF